MFPTPAMFPLQGKVLKLTTVNWIKSYSFYQTTEKCARFRRSGFCRNLSVSVLFSLFIVLLRIVVVVVCPNHKVGYAEYHLWNQNWSNGDLRLPAFSQFSLGCRDQTSGPIDSLNLRDVLWLLRCATLRSCYHLTHNNKSAVNSKSIPALFFLLTA